MGNYDGPLSGSTAGLKFNTQFACPPGASTISSGVKMLQTNSTDNWVSRDNMPPEFRPGPAVSLAEVLAVLAFIRRHLSIMLLTCFAGLCIAILYLIIVAPTFTAKAQLLVNSKVPVVDAAALSTVVESQISIIKSESIATAVIEKLGLAQDPEFETGQGSGVISRLLGLSQPKTEANAARYAVEPFERKLSVKRVGPTFLVEITFDSKNPDRAAQILNAVAETYITHQMNKTSLQDVKWVTDRLNDLSTQALTAEAALKDYDRNKAKDAADSADTRDRLAAAAESSKSAYDNFRHALRKTEVTQQQSPPVFEASLVTGASPPLRASSPKPRIVLGIAIVGGLLLGSALGVLRDLSDRIRTSGQKTCPSAEDGRIERPLPDGVRPDRQFDASAKAKPVRLTGSG
ncbi:Wzz/FepE/Etk N-terminal domain-containing protein [Bradyrhizobium diazoefficiens]|uniref:Wzz/FepE/Etk N-terminal domain-containing protein n=1 Tax=Bradyrhizobium diazoefficiens TaxID=1355477 RepID=UPI0027146805|nr:Wzz/FepE/Etk N-terminal domain-containing protein [Bradyrhizobium diazoefficiens]WLA54599.1 Wzz/FepE/Etk N-terminal domain-containing protein [Bradyrhizobium diazoefficiens]